MAQAFSFFASFGLESNRQPTLESGVPQQLRFLKIRLSIGVVAGEKLIHLRHATKPCTP